MIVTVFFLIAQIPLGVLQVTGDEIGGNRVLVGFFLTQAAGLAIVAGYCLLFFGLGIRSKRAADIHVVGWGTGLTPSPARAAGRGVPAVIFPRVVHGAHTSPPATTTRRSPRSTRCRAPSRSRSPNRSSATCGSSATRPGAGSGTGSAGSR